MKILTPDFERLDVETDALPRPLEVSDNAIQSISRLFGYDDTRKIWTPLRLVDGRVEVTTEGGYSTLFFTTSVGTTPLIVLDADPTCRNVLVRNVGSATLYIGINSTLPSFARYTLFPGETVTLVRFTETLYAVSNIGTDISIISSYAL